MKEWETGHSRGPWGLFRRLTLRRADGRVYLDRWGIRIPHVGAIMLHKMSAPDPGKDLHDHPWWFATLILWGGYTEYRADIREACTYAKLAEHIDTCAPGVEVEHRVGSFRLMRLTECHTIFALKRRTSWSLVVTGPRGRKWGFYTPDRYMHEAEYDATVRRERRDLWSDQNTAGKPW